MTMTVEHNATWNVVAHIVKMYIQANRRHITLRLAEGMIMGQMVEVTLCSSRWAFFLFLDYLSAFV